MEDSGGSSSVSVGATSTQILAPRHGRRIAFSISNYGAAIVYVNLSDKEGAIANQGIALYPGATMADSNGDIYKCWQGAINGIESGGAGTLAVWERVG